MKPLMTVAFAVLMPFLACQVGGGAPAQSACEAAVEANGMHIENGRLVMHTPFTFNCSEPGQTVRCDLAADQKGATCICLVKQAPQAAPETAKPQVKP